MEGFWNVVGGWSEVSQWWFLALVVAAPCATLAYLGRAVRIVLRGYAPTPERVEVAPELPGCDNDENLTGRCLRVGGCRSEAECNRMVGGE